MMKQSSISHTVPLITFRSIKLTQIVGFPYMQRQNFGRKKKKKKTKNHIRKTPPYTKRKILEAYSPKKRKKRLALQKRKGWKITIRKSTSLGNYTSRTIKNYAKQPQTRLLKKKKKPVTQQLRKFTTWELNLSLFQ